MLSVLPCCCSTGGLAEKADALVCRVASEWTMQGCACSTQLPSKLPRLSRHAPASAAVHSHCSVWLTCEL